jgi:ribonuclease HI
MSKPGVLVIHTDGASRGNPGQAAFAFTIARDGAPLIEEAGCLGQMTNNQAEYTALVRALEHAIGLGQENVLQVYSDSELMVNQMSGVYQVKNPDLRALYKQARQLSSRFAGVTFHHVRREMNRRADELCNEALDGERGPGGDSESPSMPRGRSSTTSSSRLQAAQEEALVCLRSAAAAWAKGDSSTPDPELVWDQLWSILEEHGILRSSGPRGGYS